MSKANRKKAFNQQKHLSKGSGLDVGFWSLLGLIFSNTLKMFFKSLPSTLFFIFIGLVLHTSLLIGPNGGFSKTSFIGHFLYLGSSPLSSMVIWTIVPMILTGIWGKIRGKDRSPSFNERLSEIRRYFYESKSDAIAVILGGIGLSLSIGGVINGYASLAMAAGIGSFLAFKSGSVISLLFRSIWKSIFNIARHSKAAKYGMAVGYVTIAASSFGFLLNSILTPDGMTIGIILLILAVAIALGVKIPSSVNPIVIFVFISLLATLYSPDFLWAHDGGWREAGGSFGSWWRSSGSTKAIIMGIPPAIGFGFGVVIQKVLNDLADQLGTAGVDIQNSEPMEQSDEVT